MEKEKRIFIYFENKNDKDIFLEKINNIFKNYHHLYYDYKTNNENYKYEEFLKKYPKPIEYEFYMDCCGGDSKTLCFYDILKQKTLEDYMKINKFKYQYIILK